MFRCSALRSAPWLVHGPPASLLERNWTQDIFGKDERQAQCRGWAVYTHPSSLAFPGTRWRLCWTVCLSRSGTSVLISLMDYSKNSFTSSLSWKPISPLVFWVNPNYYFRVGQDRLTSKELHSMPLFLGIYMFVYCFLIIFPLASLQGPLSC